MELEYKGIIRNPTFKPKATRRMMQLHSQAVTSMMNDEELEITENSKDVDFVMSIKTFASAYELELEEMIQDLNTELEKVSKRGGGRGGLLVWWCCSAG